MEREMRRKDRLLTEEETIKILKEGEYGILSLIGDEGCPYGVPVNFVFLDNVVYIHCVAAEGHKRDAIGKNPKVCFTTVSSTEVQPAQFGTKYKSAMVFGTAYFVAIDEEKKKALDGIIEKYSLEFQQAGHEYIKAQWNHTDVIGIAPNKLTGKAKI